MANVTLEARSGTGSGKEARPLDLSIVIVTWNSERWIDRCLRSIPAASEGLDYEVVIHDNASSDGTLAAVDGGSAGAGPLQLIRSSENRGFAAATNSGFAESAGRYVFLLNPDCELAPRALTELVAFLEAHPDVAAAAPLLNDEGGTTQRDFQLRRFPTLTTLVVELMLLDKLFPGNPSTKRYRYRDLQLDRPRRVEQPAGAALLLRREVFDRVGPFDEAFSPAWFEDVDYCQRLAHANLEVWVVPAARGKHFGGASLESMEFSKFAEIWYRNMWRYARKWMSPLRAEALRWAIVAGMLLRCTAALAGLAPRIIGRKVALRAYSRVMRAAIGKWEGRG